MRINTGVQRVEHVESHLELLDSFLAHAAQEAPARTLTAGILRDHARQIVSSLPEYSVEIAIADISLVAAITAYEVSRTEESVADLRTHLREFHVAVAAPHAPVELTAAA